jgi:hypothetical protein
MSGALNTYWSIHILDKYITITHFELVLTSLRRELKPVCWNIFDYSKKDLNL